MGDLSDTPLLITGAISASSVSPNILENEMSHGMKRMESVGTGTADEE